MTRTTLFVSIALLLTNSGIGNLVGQERQLPNTTNDYKLEDDPNKWVSLTDKQIDDISLRNLKRIMWAIHAYSEANEDMLPPGAVPNEALAPEKRLSGFVLLIPYFGVRPSYLAENDAIWTKWRGDNEAAKALFAKIDLKKAWDDPANAAAAKTIAPFFTLPGGAKLRNDAGYALSHFAMVRGSEGQGDDGLDNGPFPLTGKTELNLRDIKDGTVNTLCVGQIHDRLGPWIASGPSTVRHVFPPSASHNKPSFGSQHEGCAYFANCDSSTYFFDMSVVGKQTLFFLAGRNDRGHVPRDTRNFRFKTASDWKKAKEHER